ncbi:MAG: hypothetical protein LBU20_00315 [Candidatus Nomurabacteria bacterium]|jgi:hypothetical protein|nr:hypothetical protein [Candidatus Nomurabacteria bacterium]
MSTRVKTGELPKYDIAHSAALDVGNSPLYIDDTFHVPINMANLEFNTKQIERAIQLTGWAALVLVQEDGLNCDQLEEKHSQLCQIFGGNLPLGILRQHLIRFEAMTLVNASGDHTGSPAIQIGVNQQLLYPIVQRLSEHRRGYSPAAYEEIYEDTIRQAVRCARLNQPKQTADSPLMESEPRRLSDQVGLLCRKILSNQFGEEYVRLNLDGHNRHS